MSFATVTPDPRKGALGEHAVLLGDLTCAGAAMIGVPSESARQRVEAIEQAAAQRAQEIARKNTGAPAAVSGGRPPPF